ncbi:MAG: glycoside hydrolase family 15 protein, partial [Alphaproteobacteria bacterium]|nr:glycoside hydrolase family 15 protein [Alphaproteobacteria bacterium]
SRPVRIGNAAVEQTQLDVYGELLDALYVAHSHGLPTVERAVAIGRTILGHLARIWHHPDEGIWEVRGPSRHFTHSKVMAWVAFDRAVKILEQIGEQLGGAEAIDSLRRIRDDIHHDVCRRGFDPDLGSFVQAYGSKSLDASLLLLPLVGFLPPTDPRIAGTVKAIEQRLYIDGFVMRYDTGEVEDGLPPGEGAFLACSFWLADNYVLLGRLDEARELFERLLSLRNDVGLLAEEFDPRLSRQVGNFPQAFSHVALVNTAYNLTRAQGPAQQRADRRKARRHLSS